MTTRAIAKRRLRALNERLRLESKGEKEKEQE